MAARDISKKILLTGTCWYELTGLWHLLSAQGYDVCRAPLGYSCARDSWDLVIVALSAEPVAGWGQHLSRICELKTWMQGKMLVLVPERLKTLRVLLNVCQVCSGCEALLRLKSDICTVLTGEEDTVPTSRFYLTEGQLQVLKRLSERGRDRPLNLRAGGHKLYYHHARLAENAGVRDFRLLLMAGLDRDLCRAEGISNVG